jgi:hypothetical protein
LACSVPPCLAPFLHHFLSNRMPTLSLSLSLISQVSYESMSLLCCRTGMRPRCMPFLLRKPASQTGHILLISLQCPFGPSCVPWHASCDVSYHINTHFSFCNFSSVIFCLSVQKAGSSNGMWELRYLQAPTLVQNFMNTYGLYIRVRNEDGLVFSWHFSRTIKAFKNASTNTFIWANRKYQKRAGDATSRFYGHTANILLADPFFTLAGVLDSF